MYAKDDYWNKWYSSLNPDQREYFKAVTDIFYDDGLKVVGRPSTSRQLQNTIVLNLEKTISHDEFIGLADTWDVNICSFPFITRKTFRNVDDNAFQIVPADTEKNARFGGISYWAASTGSAGTNGQTFKPSANVAWHSSLAADAFFYPGYNGNNQSRSSRPFYEILSIGFEVWNTTPTLNLGGSLIRYRVPTQGRKSTVFTAIDPLAINPSETREEAYSYPMPPSTPAEATQYPDSIIAAAKEGTYNMHTIQDSESDYHMAGNDRVFFAPSSQLLLPTGNGWYDASRFNPTYDYDVPMLRGDFDMSGVYFTGLSKESTLQIRYRVVISTVPNSTNAQLVSLAKTSPDYNPKLESLISHVQAMFPPGVPVSMNPKGEWFKKVVGFGKKAIAHAIPVMADLATGNVSGAVERSIDTVKDLASRADKKVDKHTNEIRHVEDELKKTLDLLVRKGVITQAQRVLIK
jgi:hypothetical protein